MVQRVLGAKHSKRLSVAHYKRKDRNLIKWQHGFTPVKWLRNAEVHRKMALYLQKVLHFAFRSDCQKDCSLWIIVKWWKKGYLDWMSSPNCRCGWVELMKYSANWGSLLQPGAVSCLHLGLMLMKLCTIRCKICIVLQLFLDIYWLHLNKFACFKTSTIAELIGLMNLNFPKHISHISCLCASSTCMLFPLFKIRFLLLISFKVWCRWGSFSEVFSELN